VPAITEGADTLTGTSGDDNLAMLGGDDVVDGGAGHDTIAGNSGNDTMTGGEGADLFVIATGDGADVITDFVARTDRIDLTALGVTAIEDLTLTDSEAGLVITLGVDQSVTLTGHSVETIAAADFVFATNLVTGSAADEHLTGKSGVDHINGGAGRDKLDGNDGDDWRLGEAGNDLLLGGAGNDTLDGGAQNDRLHGGDDNHLLLGGDGGDQLYGDAGDDTLDGGLGKDHLWGGAGADVFVFASESNRDVIHDFQNGQDQIDVAGWGVADFAALDIRSMGSDAQIVFAASHSVTLIGVDAAARDTSDFIF
jgi:Ca2+-binding RTX toxin-like protein